MIRLCLGSKDIKPNLIRRMPLPACIVLFAFAAVALSASAQSAPDESRIDFISTFVKPGEPVPQECAQFGALVQKLLTVYEHPAAWHWIVVCDESEWMRLERHVGLRLTPNNQILAFTNLDVRSTCLRGWMLTHPVDVSPELQPDHVIRHELGHILEMTGDEVVAERRAGLLLKQRLVEEKRMTAAQRFPMSTGQ